MMTSKGTAYVCLHLPRHALTCPPSSKFMTLTATKLAQAGLSALCCLPHSQRINSFENKIGMHKKMVRIWEQHVPFTDRNSDQNSPNLSIWEQFVPCTDRNSEQNSPNLSIWEQCVPCTDRNSEQNSPNLPI